MQKTSGVISALCYLIPIIVTEWLKILHLFLATIFLGSRKVLFSSFYGNGDRGAKNHFCNATRKPPSLHRDVGRNSSCAALHLLPGAGFGQAGTSSWGTVVYLQWRLWADPAARHSPTLCRTEVLLLWQGERRAALPGSFQQCCSAAVNNRSGDRFLTAHRECGLHLGPKGRPCHTNMIYLFAFSKTQPLWNKKAPICPTRRNSSCVCCKQTAASSLPGNISGQCSSGKCFSKSLNSM